MTLKGDAKFIGKLTCCLKNDLRNLVNFHARSRKSGNLHFDLSKAYKKCKRVMSRNTEEYAKLEEKLTLGSKNGLSSLVKFNVSIGKSESLHFEVLLFSLAYTVSARKVQNYLS